MPNNHLQNVIQPRTRTTSLQRRIYTCWSDGGCVYNDTTQARRYRPQNTETKNSSTMAIAAGGSVHIYLQGSHGSTLQTVIQLLRDVRQLDLHIAACVQSTDVQVTDDIVILRGSDGLLQQLATLSSILQRSGCPLEAAALLDVYDLSTAPPDFGGLGLSKDAQSVSEQDTAEIIFLVSAHLEALNSAQRAKTPMKSLSSRPPGRRGMTLAEKILAAHDVEGNGEVRPGDIIRVDVDWIMASELSWSVSKCSNKGPIRAALMSGTGHGTAIRPPGEAWHLPQRPVLACRRPRRRPSDHGDAQDQAVCRRGGTGEEAIQDDGQPRHECEWTLNICCSVAA